MNLEYYPIRGRGEQGDKFQLARVVDENGNVYKGQYDQAIQFASEAELKSYLADMVKVPEADLTISKMHL